MIVKSLHIYPVKSLRGIDLQTADIRLRGPKGDRRFLLVRPDGGFITQRDFPKLALVKTSLHKTGITLQIPNENDIFVPVPENGKRKTVKIWRDQVGAATTFYGVNESLSKFLGQKVELVYMDNKSQRQANQKWTDGEYPVSFADGYPVLITNTASLTALNAHIVKEGGSALPMNRFRPNIVVEHGTPWREHQWRHIRIGGVELKLVKPCARCIITSIDQHTGERGPKSALKSLKTLNPSKNPASPGVVFGHNAVVVKGGQISVGQEVEIGP